MHILLVRPPDPMQHVQLLSHTRPMNLAYLASYVRRHGIDVNIVDYETAPYSEFDFIALLKKYKPDLVGVSCMTPSVLNGARLCAVAKRFSSQLATVVGGPHVNGIPIGTLEEFPSFDYGVYGEGEQTLLELCHYVVGGGNARDINGLLHREENQVVKNSARPQIENLDDIPFPARDLIDYKLQAGHAVRGVSNEISSTELFTSRGCPFPCKFCAIQTTFGKSVRFRSIENVEEEIKEFKKNYQFDHIVVGDDTFALNKSRVEELCGVFSRTGIKSWNCDTRVSTINPARLKMMKNSGCNKVAYGVETGSERISGLIGKKTSFEQIERAARWTKEAGIQHIEGNFILGVHPDETLEDIELTRKAIKSLPWTFVSVSIIVPYPGTQIYHMMKEQNLIHPDCSWEDFVMFGKPPKWNTNNFSSNHLLSMQKKITREFYLNPRYIMKQAFGVRSWKELTYWVKSGTSYMNWYFTGQVGPQK